MVEYRIFKEVGNDWICVQSAEDIWAARDTLVADMKKHPESNYKVARVETFVYSPEELGVEV